jgi:hypothetical protein
MDRQRSADYFEVRRTSALMERPRKAVIDRSPNVSEVQQETCAKSRSRRPLMQELLKRDWPAARDLLNGAPVEMHTGRYSADLFAGPRPPRQATIPNSASSSHPTLVNAPVPVRSHLDNVIIWRTSFY